MQRIYDCQHKNVNSLEKELLFKEVIRLRRLMAEADDIIYTMIVAMEDDTSLKTRAINFLNEDEKSRSEAEG